MNYGIVTSSGQLRSADQGVHDARKARNILIKSRNTTFCDCAEHQGNHRIAGEGHAADGERVAISTLKRASDWGIITP